MAGNLTEIRFLADELLMRDLEQIRGLLAHKHPSLNFSELMKIMAQMTLQKIGPRATRPGTLQAGTLPFTVSLCSLTL